MEIKERFHASLSDGGRYRMLIDAITDYAIYMLDSEGLVTSWNPGARRFKGYEESEILGEHFSRFYLEEDRKAGVPERALETAAREGKFESEGWRIRKDGTRFWAYVVIDPIRDFNGRVVGYAKITRDLTERRAAEESLCKSEEQFKILIQGVTDYAIYMLTPEGEVASWNPGAQRIKGYRPEEIIGRHFSVFYTEQDRNAGMPRVALETASREGRYEKEGWRVRKDGTRFWANIVIDSIRDDDGKLLGFAKVTRDITERRAAEQTIEKTREALVQAQKMEAIGQLTGGIAHDFNNLLMAILGSLELLQRRLSNEDPKVNLFLDNAIQGARRGSTLTQRLLAFSRRQELKPVALDAPALIWGMTDLLETSLGASTKIETRFPLNLPKVFADPGQLELAVLNLVVNARDAMSKGGQVVIAAKECDASDAGLAAGRYVCLSVADTGSGMDEETLQRATEPFFTTKGVGKGTGLGLPMVHGMTQQSGGRLILKSKLGEGTTAEVWLPVATSEPDDKSLAQDNGPPEKSRDRHVVLAVDDDSLVALNTVAMLEDLGHKVFEATSGREALEILRREPGIDLVITDQAMPNMMGSELAEAIRAERPDMPIILATGFAELPPGVGQGLPKLGKPFRQLDLARAIVEATAEGASATAEHPAR